MYSCNCCTRSSRPRPSPREPGGLTSFLLSFPVLHPPLSPSVGRCRCDRAYPLARKPARARARDSVGAEFPGVAGAAGGYRGG